MKDKKLMKIFDSICKKNDEEVKNKEDFMPICILIKEDYSMDIISFFFNNQDEKIKMREMLKQFIAVQNIKGYILIQDAKVTKVNQETGERKVSDIALRQLFTPKFAISRMQEYCDGVLGELIMKDRKDMSNTWDLWNSQESDENNKQNKEYQKYKSEHPELYKGVYELEDYNKVKDDGELIFAYKIANKEFRYFKSDKMKKSDEIKVNEVLDLIKVTNSIFKHKFVRVDKDGVEIGGEEIA